VICNGRPSRAIFSIGKVTPLPYRFAILPQDLTIAMLAQLIRSYLSEYAFCVSIENCQECGDDVPLIRRYTVLLRYLLEAV
jgi:hypothetical protein